MFENVSKRKRLPSYIEKRLFILFKFSKTKSLIYSLKNDIKQNYVFVEVYNLEFRGNILSRNRNENTECNYKVKKKSKFGDPSRGQPESFYTICVGEGATPFPGLSHFTFELYLIMPSVKQGSIKYHFLSLVWHDLGWMQFNINIKKNLVST